MRHLGIPFKAVGSNYREVHHKHLKPEQLVKFLALGKARAAAAKYQNAIIIGADTIIVYRGQIYGKPKSIDDARKMLKMLSGKMHEVCTAVVLCDSKSDKVIERVIKTKVYFRELNNQGIENYLADGNFLDKAGAYAAQEHGSGLVKKIEGDFNNVVGLPLDVLQKMLSKFRIKN